MARFTIHDVAELSAPGLYPDGDGLYLQVSSAKSKSWIYRYTLRGKARALGLGSARDVSPAKARIKRDKARAQVKEGIDLVEVKRNQKAEEKLSSKRKISFRDYTETFISNRRQTWRNAKHALQWENTLATYAYPALGTLRIDQIGTTEILNVLTPIWPDKPETANRLRGRLESILDSAKVDGLREGDNPARWKGHLSFNLPGRNKIKKVKHHPSLPFEELPVFFKKLKSQEGPAARALEFTILTAARTSETLGAESREFNIPTRTWTVPSGRMKSGKEHRIPLTAELLEMVETILAENSEASPFVFVNTRDGRALSNMAMLKVLERMGYGEITVHGFRSTFRTWVAEATDFPRELAELALAHTLGSKVELAYQRGDLFQKRRQLIEAWSRYAHSSIQNNSIEIERSVEAL